MKIRHLICLLLLLICTPVYAADVTTSLSGKSNIDSGEQFTLTLNVTANNLWGLSGNLSYDKSKLTIVGNQGLNEFTAMVGTGFSLDAAAGKSGTFGILSLTFQASNSFAPGESTTISINNMTGATDTNRLTVDNTSKTITMNIPKSSNSKLSVLKVNGNLISGFNSNNVSYNLGDTNNNEINIDAITEDTKAIVTGIGKKSLNYGINTFNIIVTAENGTTTTYTIKINRIDTRSNNNYLKSLTIKNTKINFNKSTQTYNVVVENNIDTIHISAVVEDTKASVSGTGEKRLNVYLNTFNIVVTAENGSTKTYRINISRKDQDGNAGALSTNNKLKTLEITGYVIDFNPETLRYNVSVDNTINKVEIVATLADSKATMTINNLETLSVGENLITIDVLSQSGETRTYEIVVVRKNNIPIVGIKNLLDVIEKTTSKEIEVEIKNEENIISKKIIESIKNKDIKIKINKYEDNNLKYVWTIDSKNIKKGFDFNTLVKFESNNKTYINQITNYAESLIINYTHNGELPKGTKFKVYVGNKYKENTVLNLYYFNEDKKELELKEETLIVKNGFVEYEIEHCSEYILTQAKFKNKTLDYKIIIIIVEFIIIITLTIFIILKTGLIKVKRKNKKKSTLKH